MSAGLEATGIWRDALVMPEVVGAREGVAQTAALLTRPSVRRVVVSGNGASYYAALALWTAALAHPQPAVDVVTVPAGLLAGGRFAWREGDALLAISTSGELRDVIEALDAGAPRPFAAITANPDSTIGAAADMLTLVRVPGQSAVTHTQAFVANVAAALAIWAEIAGDPGLAIALRAAPEACAKSLELAPAWAAQAPSTAPTAAIAFGSGPAWPAALEASLLLKEVAGVPAEGMETREGATSGMYALRPGHLALSLPTGDDPLVAEAERTCGATGATLLRVPGGDLADPRLAAITTFAPVVALTTLIGLGSGIHVDSPDWAAAYYATARTDAGEG